MVRSKRFSIRTRGYRPGTYGRRIAPRRATKIRVFKPLRKPRVGPFARLGPKAGNYIDNRLVYQSQIRNRLMNSEVGSPAAQDAMRHMLRAKKRPIAYKSYLKALRRIRR